MIYINNLIIRTAKRIAARRAISEFRRGRRWSIRYLEKHDQHPYVMKLLSRTKNRLINKEDYFERGVRCGFIQYHWKYTDPRLRRMRKLKDWGDEI